MNTAMCACRDQQPRPVDPQLGSPKVSVSWLNSSAGDQAWDLAAQRVAQQPDQVLDTPPALSPTTVGWPDRIGVQAPVWLLLEYQCC